jgi:small subunit ribosomal protein S17
VTLARRAGALPDADVLEGERQSWGRRKDKAWGCFRRAVQAGPPLFTASFVLLARRVAAAGAGRAERGPPTWVTERWRLEDFGAAVDPGPATLTFRVRDSGAAVDPGPHALSLQKRALTAPLSAGHSAGTPHETAARRPQRPVLVGVVTSDRMNKTRRVEVPRLVKHPRYGKYLRRRTICYAHDEDNLSAQGDTVEIMETRPLSKTKRWRLVRVLCPSEATSGGEPGRGADQARAPEASPGPLSPRRPVP